MDGTWNQAHEARPVRFDSADWARLFLGLATGAGLCFVWQMRWLPGAGWALSLLLLLGMGVWGRGARALCARDRVFIAACALLALTYGLFSNQYLRLMNVPVTAAMYALTLFSVNGWFPANAPGALGRALLSLPGACLRRAGVPFCALSQAKKNRGVWAGIALALPLGLIALLLLGAADDVFAGLFESLRARLSQGTALEWALRAVFALGLALAEFSFLYTLARDAKRAEARERAARPQAVWAVPLFVLNALYAVFVAIQFVYLFGGAQTAAMKGGYAEYARKGFFELCAVCLMNLAITGAAFYLCGHTKLLRALAGVTCAFTGVMLVSAAWRMALYISVYGLSFLRAVTLWGIFAMAALTVASAIKAAKPGARVSAGAAALVLGSWLLFNYACVDGWIAVYNIKAYERGAVRTLDEPYLASLSPDALPALYALTNECEAARRASDAINRSCAEISAYEAGATSLFLKDAPPPQILPSALPQSAEE